MPSTPMYIMKLEKEKSKSGERMTTKEIAKIDAYIETAWVKAVKQAKIEGIDPVPIYHRLMNQHAAKLGLRSI